MQRLPLSLRSLGGLIVLTTILPAQSIADTPDDPSAAPAPHELVNWRFAGPNRGGRAATCTGVASDPETYYFGAAGGGVWKTGDAGQSWRNISDGFFGGSIGAVAVAPSDPNVLYVGGGEKTVRGNVSHGDGVWRSTDAGKTWAFAGLDDTRHIGRIRVHPQSPDTAYVAAMGHLFGANEQRGVFRTTDGGQSWEKVLYVDDEVGCVDLALDPNNARVLFASFWRVKRTPYSLESGGAGSGIWRSTDGGTSWKEITENDGLPSGTWGISGVSVSPADSEVVYAMIENEEGGLYRSGDGGETWRRVNSDRNLRQRAWYYTRVVAAPDDSDSVYVLNVGFHHSKDGGKTFRRVRTPHGDNHDLWIDPSDPDRMIESNDGGANVSFDGGRSWSPQNNQPTGQFYRVSTDEAFPYRILGAQQDNSAIRMASDGSGQSLRGFESTAGGESGHIVAQPGNPDLVFGGSYGGLLTWYDHSSKCRRNVQVWPDNPMGYGAGALKYRFQWNFPIFFSPHDRNRIYTAAQCLFVSDDLGQSWREVSPDLTRGDPSKLGASGGPITKDNTSVEYYCTVFAACESPHEAGVLWAGSDDGLLHITRDAGEAWSNVTPPQMPQWAQINSIEAHPFEPGGLYVAATRYKLDDFSPYLFRTLDYGQNWTRIDTGIPSDHFTRVVRADPECPGLLYAGTERGVYVSYSDGVNWESLQGELPTVPITDLALHGDDLIAATQGRGFWVLDGLHVLRQHETYRAATSANQLFVIEPIAVSRARLGGPSGFTLRYRLPEKAQAADGPVRIAVHTADGALVRTWSTEPDEGVAESKLTAEWNKCNTFSWNTRYPDAKQFDGMILWGGGTTGPRAAPGSYTATVEAPGLEPTSARFEIEADPRSTASAEDYAAQLDALLRIRDKVTETHEAIVHIRKLTSQAETLKKQLAAAPDKNAAQTLETRIDEALEELANIEKTLYQTKNRSGQDPLNFPIRLNNRLSALAGVIASGDHRPTDASLAVLEMLVEKIDTELQKYRATVRDRFPAIERDIRALQLPLLDLDGAGQTDENRGRPTRKLVRAAGQQVTSSGSSTHHRAGCPTFFPSSCCSPRSVTG